MKTATVIGHLLRDNSRHDREEATTASSAATIRAELACDNAISGVGLHPGVASAWLVVTTSVSEARQTAAEAATERALGATGALSCLSPRPHRSAACLAAARHPGLLIRHPRSRGINPIEPIAQPKTKR